jgi:hypothetical protein
VETDEFPYVDPPADEIPGVVDVRQVVTGHDAAAVSLEEVRVHSSGLIVVFAVHMPPGEPTGGSDVEAEWCRLLREEHDGPTTGIVLGYRFGDQWRSTVKGEPKWLPRDQATAPISLVSGHNTGRDGSVAYWLWPLPEVDVTFFGSWQSQDLPFGTITVSAEQIAEARPDRWS